MMKKLFLVLMLVGLLFAQGAKNTLTGALNDLQDTSQVFLGGIIMLSMLAAVPLGLVAVGIYFLKVKGKEKPGIWKTAMMVVAALAGLAILSAVVGALIYVLTPVIMQSLLGPIPAN